MALFTPDTDTRVGRDLLLDCVPTFVDSLPLDQPRANIFLGGESRISNEMDFLVDYLWAMAYWLRVHCSFCPSAYDEFCFLLSSIHSPSKRGVQKSKDENKKFLDNLNRRCRLDHFTVSGQHFPSPNCFLWPLSRGYRKIWATIGVWVSHIDLSDKLQT